MKKLQCPNNVCTSYLQLCNGSILVHMRSQHSGDAALCWLEGFRNCDRLLLVYSKKEWRWAVHLARAVHFQESYMQIMIIPFAGVGIYFPRRRTLYLMLWRQEKDSVRHWHLQHLRHCNKSSRRWNSFLFSFWEGAVYDPNLHECRQGSEAHDPPSLYRFIVFNCWPLADRTHLHFIPQTVLALTGFPR